MSLFSSPQTHASSLLLLALGNTSATVGDDDDGSDNNHAMLYFIGGCLSALFCLYVMSTYLLFPHLRQHPSQIATLRAMCDLIFNLGFIFTFLIGEPGGDSNACLALSLANQFSAFASNGWYLILSIDLFKAIRNPFFMPQDSMKLYHTFVWTSSLITSIVLVAGNKWGYSLFDFCWIKVSGEKDLNTYSWALFYVPVMIFYLISLAVVIFASVALGKGLPESHEIRKRVLTQGRRYVFQFFIYWTFAGSVWAAQYVFVSETSQKEYPLIVVFSLTIAIRGLADAVILVWSTGLRPRDYIVATANLLKGRSGRTALREPLLPTGAPAGQASGPNVSINLALRKEIMLCTTWGIVETVKSHYRSTHPGETVSGSGNGSREGQNNMVLQKTAPSSRAGSSENLLASAQHQQHQQHQQTSDDNDNDNGNDSDDDRRGLSPDGALVNMFASSPDILATNKERTTSMRSVVKFADSSPDTPAKSAEPTAGSGPTQKNLTTPYRQLTDDNTAATLHGAGFSHDAARIASLDFGEVVSQHMRKKRGDGGYDFKDYAPSVFAALRSCYGTSSKEYLSSFVAKDSLREEKEREMLEKFTEGRSGSFFYFCHDMRYIVKTVTGADLSALRRILPMYFDHFRSHPDSLLARFCGLHAIRLSREQEWIHFVVMENSIYTKLKLHERYDMKGSWIARQSLKRGQTVETVGVMKDTDFINLSRKVFIGEHRRAKIMDALERDARFLESMGIMDYSLLLAIHRQDGADSTVRSAVAEAQNNENAGFVPTHGRSAHTRPRTHSSLGEANATDYSAATETRSSRSSSVSSFSSMGPSDAVREHVPFFRHDHGGMQGCNATEPCLYFVGVIDILQEYDFSKKLEHFAKSKLLFKDAHGISAVAPREYRERFVNAMKNVFA